jgi:SAM-dependent methyltransferase
MKQPPLPPLELRRLVGPTDPESYAPYAGGRAFPALPGDGKHLRSIFDFGCGCGRQARQLILQTAAPLPERYVGVDVSKTMIDWCVENITPYHPQFTFHHHDVASQTYGPGNSSARVRPLEFAPGTFTLVNAHSVFTHLEEDQAGFYAHELSRLMAPDGLMRLTWLVFNREIFPPLASHQNCLFLNSEDVTQAVYFAWDWIVRLIKQLDFLVADIHWPLVTGAQFPIYLTRDVTIGRAIEEFRPPNTVVGFH